MFVSYAHEDRVRAQALIQVLERAGFRIWWDGLIVGGARVLLTFPRGNAVEFRQNARIEPRVNLLGGARIVVIVQIVPVAIRIVGVIG